MKIGRNGKPKKEVKASGSVKEPYYDARRSADRSEVAKTSIEDARDCAIEVIRNYVSKLDARAEHAKTIDARHEERMNHRLDQLHSYCDTFTDWINDEKDRVKAYCKDAIDTWKAERLKDVWSKLDWLEIEVTWLQRTRASTRHEGYCWKANPGSQPSRVMS